MKDGSKLGELHLFVRDSAVISKVLKKVICDAGALCCISIYGGILREYVMGVYHECVLCMSVYYET